jgi:hypothetical protein
MSWGALGGGFLGGFGRRVELSKTKFVDRVRSEQNLYD